MINSFFRKRNFKLNLDQSGYNKSPLLRRLNNNNKPIFEKNNKQNLLIAKGVLYRVGKGRSNIENDSTHTSMAVRFYIRKDATTNEFTLTNRKLDQKSLEHIKEKVVKPLNSAFEKVLSSDGNLNCDTSRIQIFFSEEDDFFSVVLGTRYDAKKTNIQEIRYKIALSQEIVEYDIYIIVINNVKSHEATSKWDISHCEEGPVEDFSTKTAVNKFLDINTPTSPTKGTTPSKRKAPVKGRKVQ